MDKSTIKQYAKDNPRRDVAVVGLRDDDGNVLLMRTHKLPELWQPVGGGVDPSDSSPRSAAAREVREEFGVVIEPSALNEVLATPYDFGEGTVYFFETKISRERVEFHTDASEVVEYRWFSIKEALKLAAMPATKKYLMQLSYAIAPVSS